MDLGVIIGIQDIKNLVTFIDSLFTAYDRIIGFTWLVIDFVINVFTLDSKIQFLNTKCDTECKFVVAGESLPRATSIYLFLDAQSFPLTSNLPFDDNKSIIKLEIDI